MKKALFLLFAFTYCLNSFSQTDTEFWFAVPKIIDTRSNNTRLCFISYDQKADITISQPANPNFNNGEPIKISLAENSFVVKTMDEFRDAVHTFPYNTPLDKGLLIKSSSPISSYYIVANNNSEIYTLKGKNALGDRFLVPMQSVYANGSRDGSQAYSSIEILATEDNTTVKIKPTKACFGVLGTDTIRVGPLNKGQTYSIRSSGFAAGSQLGGSIVISDKPIAVNTTDDMLVVGSDLDLVGDQLVPIKFSGNEFIAVKNVGNVESVYVYATEPGVTSITVNAATKDVTYGTPYYQVLNDPATYIKSNGGKIVVFQVSSSGNELGATMLPNIECTGSSDIAYDPTFSNTNTVNACIVTRKENKGEFYNSLIDEDLFYPVPGTSDEWYYSRQILRAPSALKPARLSNYTGVFHMSVLDYGLGGTASFGYFSNYNAQPIGAVSGKEYYISGQTLEINIPNLSALSKLTLTLPDGTSHTYDNTSGTLTNPIYTQPNIQPEHQGSYTIDAERVNNCPVEPETLHLSIYTPSVAQSDTMCLGDQYQLTAPGYGPYTWTPTTPQNQNQKYNTITPTQGDTTYTHTVLSTQPGINLAANPHFSQGNTSFSTDYTYNTLSLTTPGQYTIGKNPLSYNPLYTNTPDHTQDTAANQLIINCSSGESTLWSQTINNLKSGQHYEFSAWYTNITPHATPVNIKYKENGLYTYQHDNDGNLITDPITGNPIEEEPFILPADNQWHQHTYAFKAQGTSITLNIEAVNTQSGSSLSIDDIRLSPLYALTDTIHIHVRDSLKPQLQTPPYICQGIAHIELTETYNTYTWSTGETTPSITLTQAGDYHVRVTEGQDGCARGTLFFTVQPTPPLNITTNPLPEICSGQNHFDLPYTITQGTPGTYSLTYDETAKAAGFQDIEKAPITTPNIQIPLPANTQAGNYNLHLTIYESGCDGQGTITPSPQIPFTVQYNPDQTLTQRWNDILSVKNQQYNNGTNEGYQFTSYQWYKNGEKLQDQTHSYLYEPHKFQSGDTYSVKLGRSDGSEIHTCDFTPQIHPDDTNLLQPVESLINPNSPITISGLTPGQTITARLWDLHGRVINTRHLDTSASPCTISSPSRSGIYILELTDARTEEQSFFKVLVK